MEKPRLRTLLLHILFSLNKKTSVKRCYLRSTNQTYIRKGWFTEPVSALIFTLFLCACCFTCFKSSWKPTVALPWNSHYQIVRIIVDTVNVHFFTHKIQGEMWLIFLIENTWNCGDWKPWQRHDDVNPRHGVVFVSKEVERTRKNRHLACPHPAGNNWFVKGRIQQRILAGASRRFETRADM